MKITRFVTLGMMLFSAAVCAAQTAPAVDPKKAAPKTAPAAAAKKDDKKKKADEMGKIEGMELARGTGFLGVQIVNGVFKLTAYDAKKKPVAADFTRVVLRWSVPYQKNVERTQLTAGSGVGVFTSEKIVKPPYAFKLFITLLKGDADDAPGEAFTLDFRT